MFWNIGCKMVAARCGSALKSSAYKFITSSSFPFLSS
jgi:hypothetical protein